jgi:hypothetical protein
MDKAPAQPTACIIAASKLVLYPCDPRLLDGASDRQILGNTNHLRSTPKLTRNTLIQIRTRKAVWPTFSEFQYWHIICNTDDQPWPSATYDRLAFFYFSRDHTFTLKDSLRVQSIQCRELRILELTQSFLDSGLQYTAPILLFFVRSYS